MHQGHLGIFSCPYLRLSSQVMHIPGDPCHLTNQGLLQPCLVPYNLHMGPSISISVLCLKVLNCSWAFPSQLKDGYFTVNCMALGAGTGLSGGSPLGSLGGLSLGSSLGAAIVNTFICITMQSQVKFNCVTLSLT